MTPELREALKNWTKLNEILPGLSEEQVRELLDWEIKHGKRVSQAERLHQRYNALRVMRERRQLLTDLGVTE